MDPERVLSTVADQAVHLKSILTTHHHWDHAGGNEKLAAKFTGAKALRIYGGDDRIGALTDKVKQDDEIRLGNLTIRCIFTPCHTTGHICYFIESPNGNRAVFTGDTLFQGEDSNYQRRLANATLTPELFFLLIINSWLWAIFRR